MAYLPINSNEILRNFDRIPRRACMEYQELPATTVWSDVAFSKAHSLILACTKVTGLSQSTPQHLQLKSLCSFRLDHLFARLSCRRHQMLDPNTRAATIPFVRKRLSNNANQVNEFGLSLAKSVQRPKHVRILAAVTRQRLEDVRNQSVGVHKAAVWNMWWTLHTLLIASGACA